MELLTKDTHLDYSEDGTSFKELYGLSGYPDMGGEPDKVDVSNMRDGTKRSINGLQDVNNLTFDFYYNSETSEDSGNVIKKAFSDLKKQEGKKLHWRLVYPDGSGYAWQGMPTVFMKSAKVGDPMTFSLVSSLESALEYNDSISMQNMKSSGTSSAKTEVKV